ncbi:PREDICTED: E3 ubiquitin-protein ligase RBBP6-like isoform X2 [Nelumbo nucifera]|uniref:E3 ubiquitin-protein ligase RBBP6-like isoform X2 n=1 Tax=Nelumbo nucifera TaxID=4432 RepID=A0A1U8A629_NELNU|nr:PREDICTED: E3 ubiquitin-protein ligase RBBP6-like isoform X2 [Nelumbo nucifera]
MAVRFKFRSSVDFDSVDIDGRPSISIRDLRSKILQKKNLKICEDFHLDIADADTGEEYKDESFLVPSGSSVIIKRVPAGRSTPSSLPPISSVKNLVTKQTNFVVKIGPSSTNIDMDNFDDFGVDLCPSPEEPSLSSDSDVDKMNHVTSGKADSKVPRCIEPSVIRFQNPEPSDLSEASPTGPNHHDAEENKSQTKLKSKVEEQKKLDGVFNTSSPALPNTDLPSELRCSLCNTIFKEAVMIPCCQHSFCDKCIRLVLIEKARCPKCLSSKCRVENLLPNVSLRQAIEHFLESQILISGSDNIIPKYAPDGESAIQVKEASCAVSVQQREPVLSHSPSATGKGSNQVMTESAGESLIKNNTSTSGTGRIIYLGAGKSVKSAPSSNKLKQISGERDATASLIEFKGRHESLKVAVDFQGENQPLNLPQTLMQKEEANLTSKKKKGMWINTADGTGSFMATSRHRKGDRTCYMCGSPDHFIRDCPAASSPHPMLQTGDAVFPGGMPAYGPSYWHGSPLTHVRPYANIYGAPGMMPFDPTMVPVTPFAVPSYMPSLYAGLPVPCGLMRMGGLVPPVVTGAERPLSRAEFMELGDCEQKNKLANERQQRQQSNDSDDLDERYRYNELERSHDCKPRLEREDIGSYSEDTVIRRSLKKHTSDKCLDEDIHSVDWRHEKGSRSSTTGRDRRPYYSDRSSSEIQDISDNSNQHSKKRYKHHRGGSRKHSEKKYQYDSDSSQRKHRGNQKELENDRHRDEANVKRHRHKHHSHSESGLEPSSSRDQKRRHKEKESSRSSRHLKHKVKSTDDQLSNDRWEMYDGLDENWEEDYQHHKRKRLH